jgi:hypothetical protein
MLRARRAVVSWMLLLFSQPSRTYPVDEYRSRSARKPKGKRTKLPYPPKRCAALMDTHTQCSENAIESTGYCARHQKPGFRE